MASATIGLLHPGDMGSMVGASARANGLRVLWASEGRSAQTLERAAAAGLEDMKGLAPVVAASQVILSVCPPHAAVGPDRQAQISAIDLFLDAGPPTQEQLRLCRVHQPVATRPRSSKPHEVWRARELDEALSHGAASPAAAERCRTSSRR